MDWISSLLYTTRIFDVDTFPKRWKDLSTQRGIAGEANSIKLVEKYIKKKEKKEHTNKIN